MVNYNFQTCRAAPMGELGIVITNTQLRSDAPYLPINYINDSRQNSRLGTYVQDGDSVNMHGYGHGRLTDVSWMRKNNDFSVNQGWLRSDTHVPDKSVEMVLGGLPSYSERAANAKTYNAKFIGQGFLPLPGPWELKPGEQPRGGLVPIPTTADSTDPTYTGFTGDVYGIFSSRNPTGEYSPYINEEGVPYMANPATFRYKQSRKMERSNRVRR